MFQRYLDMLKKIDGYFQFPSTVCVCVCLCSTAPYTPATRHLQRQADAQPPLPRQLAAADLRGGRHMLPDTHRHAARGAALHGQCASRDRTPLDSRPCGSTRSVRVLQSRTTSRVFCKRWRYELFFQSRLEKWILIDFVRDFIFSV